MFNHVEADREEPCQGLLEQGRPEKGQGMACKMQAGKQRPTQASMTSRLNQHRRKHMDQSIIIEKNGRQSHQHPGNESNTP